MKLYTGPVSLFSAKVRIALDEKGLVPDEHVSVDWSPEHRYLPHHPDVAALNPRGEVPVLVEGGDAICDSTSILEYLEERHPEPALYPTTPAMRARCRTLEAFADETLFAPLWDLIEEGFYPAEQGGRDETRLASSLEALGGFHAELDGELAGREFLCDTYSVADIANFVMLSAGATMGALPDPANANLAGWLVRTASRPAGARGIRAIQAHAAGLRRQAAPAAARRAPARSRGAATLARCSDGARPFSRSR